MSTFLSKNLNKKDTEDLSISGLFDKSEIDFKTELTKYCLTSLTSIHDACQGCIDILIEQGVADHITWSGKEPNLYDDLYKPYYNKLGYIEEEMKVRQDELNTILGVYDSDNILIEDGVQSSIVREKEIIQDILNFQNYIGNDLWLEFCAFRREDKYSNSNYISDGLNNAELFERALDFIEVANKEIYKSSELQHSISSTIKNLLVIKKFKPLVEYFEVGNWIRIRVDDTIYKLRLLKYEIDFDSLDRMSSVDFSDVMKTADGISDQQSVIQQATSMATSYDCVKRQANQGANSNAVLNGWFENGLDATNTKIVGGADNQTQTWDEHGMLFRKYDSITDSYDDIQLKIINSTIAITTDNWETVKTAIGSHIFYNPETGKLEQAYGVNAETLVGKLIIGENLGIYNQSGSMKFTDNGLEITNGTNTFSVNPNNDKLLKLSNSIQDLLFVNQNGDLEITGKITATSGYIGGTTGFEIGSRYIRNGKITNATNTTVSGVYVGTDGFNVSGGTPATTSYFTKTGMNIGNKLTWDGTKLSVEGDVTATSGKIGMFTISNNDDGLYAYYDDSHHISQYGLGYNRFYVFLRGNDGVFCSHIDLDNGLDREGDTPSLHIGSKGYVKISSESEILFSNITYDETGVKMTGEPFAEITNTGEIRSYSANAFRALSNDYGFIIRNDNNCTYFLLTNQYNQKGTFNDLRPLFINNSTGEVTISELNVTGNNTVEGITRLQGSVFSTNIRDNTSTSTSANVCVTSSGRIYKSSSASKYKLDIKPLEQDRNYAYNILKLQPKQWFDKTSVENYAAILTSEYKGEKVDNEVLETVDTIDSCYGLIAEDVIEAGLEKYCFYNSNKEVEGVMYDRLWTLLIPIVNDLKKQVDELTKRVNELN